MFAIGMYSGAAPWELRPNPGIINPVLTREHVSDVPAAAVADPFMIRSGCEWCMFFEVMNLRTGRGEIALARSRDGSTWTYDRIILAEPFHMSYPGVFEWEGYHFMVPETRRARAVRLYRAQDFPSHWTFVANLLEGPNFTDPTLLRHDGRWWLFTECSELKHDTLRLFYADELPGSWQEHPCSPIVRNNARTARPGGSIVHSDAGLLRFAQNCETAYGVSICAFQITELTTSRYAEQELPLEYPLGPSGAGWNACGMHHVDPHATASGGWVACVDGWYTEPCDPAPRPTTGDGR